MVSKKSKDFLLTIRRTLQLMQQYMKVDMAWDKYHYKFIKPDSTSLLSRGFWWPSTGGVDIKVALSFE